METTALFNRLTRLSAVNLCNLAASLGIARRDPAPFGKRKAQKAEIAALIIGKAELRFTRATVNGATPFLFTSPVKDGRHRVSVLRAPSARFCYRIGVSK